MAPILKTYSKKQHKSNRSGVQIYQNTFKKKKIHKQEINMMDISVAAGLFDISSISRKVKVDDTFDRILKSENYKPVNYDPCLLCKTDSISTNDSSKSKSFIDIDNLLHRPYMTRSKCRAKVFLDSHCGKTSRLKTLDEPVTNSLEIEYDHKVNNVNYTSLNIGSTLESEDHMSLQKSNMKLVQESFRINRDENDCRNLFHNISSAISSTPAITTKMKIVDDTLSPITTRSADAKKYGCLKDISNIQYEKAPSNASPHIRRRKTDRRRYNRIICLSNSSINSASGINGSKSIFINTMDSSHGVEYIDLRSKSIFTTNDLLENKSTSSKHISDIRMRVQRSINDNDSNPKVCSIRELDVSKYSTGTQNSFESSSRLEVYHESNFQGQQSNNSSNVSLYVSPKMNIAKVELTRLVLQDQSINSNSRKDAIQKKFKPFDAKRTFENNTFDAQELAKANFTDKIVFRGSENTKHSNLMTTKDNTTKCNESSRILDENYVSKLNIDNLNDCNQARDDSTRCESFAMENDTSIFSEASQVVDNNEISKHENNESDHIVPEQFVNSACGSETSENDFTNTFNEGSHVVDDNEVSKLQKEVLVRVTNLNLSDICKTTKSNYGKTDQSIYGRLVNSTRCESLASESDITNTFNEGSQVVDDNEGDAYKLVSNGNFDNNVITRGIWENTRSRSKSSSMSIVGSSLEQSKNNSGFKSSRVVDDNEVSKLQKDVVVNVTNINLSDICETIESNYDERNQDIYGRVVNSTRCESSASENDITNTFNEGSHVVDDNEGDAYKSVNRGNLDSNVITRGIWENTRSRRQSCVVSVVDSSLEQSKNNSECKSSRIVDDNEVSKLLSKKSISKFQEENVNISNFNRSDDAYKITNRGNFDSNVCSFVSIVDSSLEQSTNNSKLSNLKLTSGDCIELFDTRDSKFCIDLSEMKNSKDTISTCKENQNCDNTQRQINVSQENNHVSIPDTSSTCVSSHSHNKGESIQNILSSSDSTEDFLGFHDSNDTSEAVQVVDTLKDTIRNEENLLSLFVRETTVTSTPKVMGPPPCERLAKRKPSVVKTGKSWRRSLYEARKIKTENDCSLNKDICKTTKSNYDERDQSIYGRLVNSTRCESSASENDITNTFNEGSRVVDDNEGDAYKSVNRGNLDNNVITRGIWENTRSRSKSSVMSIVDSSSEQSKNNSGCKSSRIVDDNEVLKLASKKSISKFQEENVVNVTNFNRSDDAYKITNRGYFDSNVCGFVSIMDSSLEQSTNNSRLSHSKLTSDDCIELDETRDSKLCMVLSEMENWKEKVNQNYDDERRQNNVSQENNHASIPDKSSTCVSSLSHNKGESIQNISSSSDSTEDFLGFHSGNDTSEAVQVVDTLKDTIRNGENWLSMFVRKTTVISTPKVMGPPPCERLVKRKPSVVKTGKSWRRSLYEARKIKIENDCSLNKGRVSTCTPNFTRLNCGTPALRRDSIRIVPVSATSKAPQAGSVLEKYAADVFQSYISDALPEDLLEEYLENISLTRDTLSLTLRETNLVPAVTAKEIVLRRCGQTEPLPFRKCYPNTLLHNCQKIGEGVYGEVFLFRNQNRETTVMKIIPIEGDIMVNGERQKKFSEILSEIIIAMELSNLRNNETNSTSGFSDLGKISCVQGKYPSMLLDRWELYEESRGSENDSPIVFMDDQLFIVMEFTNGGKDLETFVFNNAQQAYSVFVQVTCALAIAERQLEFEHRDLHWGNILIAGVDRNKTLDFVVDGKKVELDTNGVEATIIDFTLSRITYDGVCIYNDLSLEPDLFTSSGDYQFDIYRLMQEHNGNKWQQFVPYTNVLWLHYMVDKTINALRYKYVGTKIHKCYVKKLTEVRAKMLDFKCAGEILNFLLNL